MEVHRSLVYWKDKTTSFLTKEGNIQEIQGIKTNIKLPSITANQLNKCNFFKEQIQYLGHVVSSEGISEDLEAVVADIESSNEPVAVDNLQQAYVIY